MSLFFRVATAYVIALALFVAYLYHRSGLTLTDVLTAFGGTL